MYLVLLGVSGCPEFVACSSKGKKKSKWIDSLLSHEMGWFCLAAGIES